ncbi:MAG: DUF4242 domain-containing protein [Chloroflexi bacterium]|nr:DUF4242 domain-containing protein [Chloroflexota bacterium]
MPKFVDFHADLKLPPDVQREFSESAKYGRRDRFDVRIVQVYYTRNGQTYCVTEAPNAEAVRRSHAMIGVGTGDIYQVDTLV